MIFEETNLKGLFAITPKLLTDERGAFTRTFCKNEFEKIGLKKSFVQINHSYNLKKGTFRGLHFQKPPFEEGKLVRCIKGTICDIVVDLRIESNTFLQHCKIELSDKNLKMLYIPEGLAHGFITLEDNTEVLYHHTEFYQPEANTGISVFSDILKITLPIDVEVISEKDKSYPIITQDFSL